MGFAEDYGLDSFARKWTLVLLKLRDKQEEKETDILRINKMLRYFDHLLNQKNIDFSNYKLGAVSDEIRETIDEFEESDLVTRNAHDKYTLTKDGELAEKEIETGLNENDIKLLQFTKNLLNDLPDDELLFFMYLTFPETKKNSTEFDRLNKKMESLVALLYSKGKISVATGAKWLNLSEETFLHLYKIQLTE